MITKLKEYTKQKLTQRLLDNEAHVSYSQEGEDVVLRRFLDLSKPGFYVDVGAHHPVRYSNTKYYYDRGWSGINIDADPTLIDEFKTHRTRDINLISGVGDQMKQMTFYMFNHPAINTFDAKLAAQRAKLPEYEIVNKLKIKIRSLAELLENHLPKGKDIHFMSIDVEGQDLNVLRSNNWAKYRPAYILIECLGAVESLEAVFDNEVTGYLRGQGYQPIAKTLYTVIFGDRNV